MKVRYIIAAAVLSLMATACSDEVTATDNGGSNNEGQAKAYLKLKVDFPWNGNAATTRAAINGKGQVEAPSTSSSSDYKVYNATMLIFKRNANDASEDSYTYLETVDLSNIFFVDDNLTGESGISNQSDPVVVPLEKGNLGDNDKFDGKSDLYGLVLVNYLRSANDKAQGTKVKIDETSTLTSGTTKYEDWNVSANTTVDDILTIGDNENPSGYLMANAPGWAVTNPSTTTPSGDPVTLVQIPRVYGSEEAATVGNTTTVYVERAMAKVSVICDGDVKDVKNDNQDKVQLQNWALDIVNKTSYPVHNVSGLSTDFSDIWKTARFRGTYNSTGKWYSSIGGDEPFFYRTMWGEDPNYSGSTLNQSTSKDACDEAFNHVSAEDVTFSFGEDHPVLCPENTFNINNMTQGQTTRVVFKAQYDPSAYFNKGLSPSDVGYYTKGTTFYIINGNITDDPAGFIEDATASALKKDPLTDNISVSLKEGVSDDITKAGKHKITTDNITVTINDATQTLTEENVAAINSALGIKTDEAGNITSGGISTYENGTCYYVARIKHFGNDETPWSYGDPTYGSGDDANKKYLGRYGILRNNSYELTVGNVYGPGSPDIPTPNPEDPDDKSDAYINVTVKILDWAGHTQYEDLE